MRVHVCACVDVSHAQASVRCSGLVRPRSSAAVSGRAALLACVGGLAFVACAFGGFQL